MRRNCSDLSLGRRVRRRGTKSAKPIFPQQQQNSLLKSSTSFDSPVRGSAETCSKSRAKLATLLSRWSCTDSGFQTSEGLSRHGSSSRSSDRPSDNRLPQSRPKMRPRKESSQTLVTGYRDRLFGLALLTSPPTPCDSLPAITRQVKR